MPVYYRNKKSGTIHELVYRRHWGGAALKNPSGSTIEVGHATLITKFELMQITESASDKAVLAITAENEKLGAALRKSEEETKRLLVINADLVAERDKLETTNRMQAKIISNLGNELNSARLELDRAQKDAFAKGPENRSLDDLERRLKFSQDAQRELQAANDAHDKRHEEFVAMLTTSEGKLALKPDEVAEVFQLWCSRASTAERALSNFANSMAEMDNYKLAVRAHLSRVKKALFAAKGRVKELEGGAAFSALLSQIGDSERKLRDAKFQAEYDRVNSANRERAARNNAHYWKTQCALANEQARSQLGVGSPHTAMAVDCDVAPPIDAPEAESIATLSLRISALERGLEKSRRGS